VKKSLIIFAILLVAAGVAAGQRRRFDVQEEETIRRTLEFSPGNGTRLLEVDGVSGSIHVTGYDGQNVEMVANKTIRAESQAKVQTAKQEVRLDIADRSDTVRIYVDQPGHNRSTTSSRHSDWHDRGYEVKFDFEVRVPRRATVHLWTVNDGDIHVQDVAGDFDVSNVNGAVELLSVAGSGRAHTINGPTKVTFASNPKQDSSFASLNGTIEVAFQRNLSADLRFKTLNGGVYTDFPVTTLPSTGTGERRNGKFVYKSGQFSAVRVGNGGPELRFDGLNGDIRILQAR
jgi:hypothetical protein